MSQGSTYWDGPVERALEPNSGNASAVVPPQRKSRLKLGLPHLEEWLDQLFPSEGEPAGIFPQGPLPAAQTDQPQTQ